ncbi:unnamed protein product [Mytilus coruscus]|uniref:G-protein coupled receptors family 1 profile domain-containing protein n=1 Tax=Mytilus coruscus TaxID=42192 RepID=A0A6J8CKQ5_MYTCO|nr:unnamed protein product [Mytilus coruscus]
MNRTNYDKLSEWNNELLQHYIINDVILGIYLILGTSGNAIVVLVYAFRMNKKKDDRYFIPFLAVVDLLACVCRSSLELAMNFNPVRFQGSVLCKAVWFPTNVTAIASIFLLLVIAIQRYLKVCRPFGLQMTLACKRFSLIVCIVVAVSVSAPLIVYNDEIEVINPETNVTGYVCDTDVKSHYGQGFLAYIIFASVCSLVLMVALTILNICIGRTIFKQLRAKHRRKSSNNVISRHKVSVCAQSDLLNVDQDVSISDTETSFQPQKNSSLGAQNNSQTQINSSSESDTQNRSTMSFSHRYSIMFMAIGVAFIISYSPRLILLFITLHDPKFFGKISQTNLTILSVIREMNVVNNVVNPFIYGFFDHTFRKETKKICFKVN